MKTATRRTAAIGFILVLFGTGAWVVSWNRWTSPLSPPPIVTVEPELPEGWLSGTLDNCRDGDTLRLLTATKQSIPIRLNGIDAPELAQPHGHDARRALLALCEGQELEVAGYGRDRYGRIIGDVRVKGRWLSGLLVKQGWAWHFKEYSDNGELAALEIEARTDKRGLWADEKPVAPWEYRKARRANGDND